MLFPDDGIGQAAVSDWVAENCGKLNLYDGMIEKDVKTSTDCKWRWINGSIDTPEGSLTVRIGDYVIKGIKNEFYPCKPNIFEETYEALESEVL